jgi:hypothetical protein
MCDLKKKIITAQRILKPQIIHALCDKHPATGMCARVCMGWGIITIYFGINVVITSSSVSRNYFLYNGGL